MNTTADGSRRLDKTLSSEALAYKDGVSLLVKNHLLKSPLVGSDGNLDPKDQRLDEVTQHWSSKIWTFLDDLRGASVQHTGKLVPTNDTTGSNREWKLKDESDRYRVMYREGPVGTPYHTLCLDGVVDGDFASALCVAWESPMFKEWWPQFMVPTFKITESKWLRRIRVGEDLSLIRFKVPWPLAQREVLMSAFALEHLQQDLIIVLVESVPESVEINEKLHGFSASDLPTSASNVRMGVDGGYVMQRFSKDQFFFRTIMNLDMKIDFVPPWMINFISRQVAGQGLKLYQKAVLAVSNGSGYGKAFQKLLKTGYLYNRAVLAVSNGTGHGKAFQKPLKTGDLYNRIRSGLEAKTAANGDPPIASPTDTLPAVKDSAKTKGSIRRMGSSENTRVVPYPVTANKTKEDLAESDISSVEEPVQPQLESILQAHKGRPVEDVKLDVAGSSSKHVHQNKFSSNDVERREYDDPEVEWALNILDKMILFTQSCAAGQASALKPRNGQAVSTSSGNTEPDHRESLLKNSKKPPLAPLKNLSCCNRGVEKTGSTSRATQNLDNVEVRGSPGQQLAGGDAESSGTSTSGFWSASEIEIVSSQDDTDSGKSGTISGQLKVEEPEVAGTKQRRRKWRWTCFSPSHPREHGVHGRANFYARDSGRASEGHWKNLMGDSTRFVKGRGYLTDSDEVIVESHSLEDIGHSPDRFVTLGELLMDNER